MDSKCCQGELWEAAGFKLNEQSVERFMDEVQYFWDSYHFPDMRKENKWRLQLRKTKMFKHHSIVVEFTETGKSFIVELRVSEEEGVFPLARKFDPRKKRHQELFDLGEVTMSAYQLFDNVLKCAEEFGDYHMVTNNCQHFCQNLASKMRCGSSVPMTDTGKAALGIVGGVIACLGAVIAALFSGMKNKQS